MPLKEKVKKFLQSARLLPHARRLIYWGTRFDLKTTHPRRKMLRFYSAFVKKRDLCFDVGANVGDRTSLFLELGAKVVCVEPQKICLIELHRKFNGNKNVVIVEKGLSNEKGSGELAVCQEAPALSSLSEKWLMESRFSNVYHYRWTKRETIMLTTLDELIGLYGAPAFCKVDVEGYEKKVLQGLSRPIPSLSFEFNKEFLEDAMICARHLKRLGSYRFNFSLAEPMDPLSGEWLDPGALFRKIKSIPDNLLWGDIYARLP